MHDHESLRRPRAPARALADGARETSAEEAVRQVFAVQAQDASAPNLGVRVRGSTTASVDAIVPAHPDIDCDQLRAVEQDRRSPLAAPHPARAAAA
ncbi:hypothetical protein [Streptomyces sp. NPDC014894]|uniref:hypothetical protein n=1 Tax=Streptomyces sp. NPDC014894 TaxID=3364931 RepID=UPI0036FB155F